MGHCYAWRDTISNENENYFLLFSSCIDLLREVAALPTDGARAQVHRRSVRALFSLICSSFSAVFVVCKLATHVNELSYIAYSYNESFINSLK